MAPVSQIRRKLLRWYDRHRRVMPWRATGGETPDPYRVWLSEIMLQQTTTAHAEPYFLAFTSRWPRVGDLAAAADSDVMAAWAGLGYYARARNLLACARVIASDHKGAFPNSEAGLRALPGVGPYTAAAVGAIAFNLPTNVVDGNVERVMARLFAVKAPLPDAKPELWSHAARFVTSERPGDWAQALMDLGATVCRPRGPDCSACPIADACAARTAGEPEDYPRRAAKAARPKRRGVAFVALAAGQAGLLRRPPRGLLGGMLGLPGTPWREAAWPSRDAMRHAPFPGRWRDVGVVDHVFTHFSLELSVRLLAINAPIGDFEWTPVERAVGDLPSVFRLIPIHL